jgi:hypothetical protein
MKHPLASLLRRSHFSNVVGTGDWSADILVRLGATVNPQAHRRTRMSALQKNVSGAPSLLAAGVLAGLGASLAAADTVPQVITYQGQIQKTSGAALSKGVYIIKALVWDNATGGSLLWGKIYPVNVDGNGNFNVVLGDGGGVIPPAPDTPAPAYDILGQALDGGPRFLGITVVQTPAGAVLLHKEVTPRMQLVSSPYALHAGMADYALTWNGLTATQLASVTASGPAAGTSAVLGYDGTNVNPMPLTMNSNPPGLVFNGPATINGALLLQAVNTSTLYPQTTNGIVLKSNVRLLGSLTPRAWAVPYTETTDGYLIVNWGYYFANPRGNPSQVWVTLSGLGKIILFQFADEFLYPSSGFTLLPIPAGMTYTVGATGDGSNGYPGTNWFQAIGQ